MPEIQPADREVLTPDEIAKIKSLLEERISDAADGIHDATQWRDEDYREIFGGQTMMEKLLDKLTLVVEAVVRDKTTATTPPEPRALTAEEIKAAIPANGHDGLNYTANYSKRLRWCHKRNGEFEISIDEKPLPLESLTDAKLDAIVAALGIAAGVKS